MCMTNTIIWKRGGEPGRLLLTDWVQAKNGEWLYQQVMKYLDNIELLLMKSMKIVYITGKGNNHLLPVLIRCDTVPAIQKIADPKFCMEAGVAQTNKFFSLVCRDQRKGICQVGMQCVKSAKTFT